MYCVYALVDPKNNQIFYIGKGKKYRPTAHLKPSVWKNPKNTTNPFLYFKIKSLMENNVVPEIQILYETDSEEAAYNKELELIHLYGRRFVDGGQLFNITDTKGGPSTSKPWSEERKINYKVQCKKIRIYDPTYDELYNDFITLNLTRKQIALKYNCSDVLIKKRLQELNIKKPKSKRYPSKNKWTCPICGKDFDTPNSVKRKFCSWKCRDESKRSS
jgi:hypothetical protein